MVEQQPTIDEQRRLYDAALKVAKLKPWNWMDDTDYFGVEDPESGELGFVTVQGDRQYRSVSCFLGLHSYLQFADYMDAEDLNPLATIQIRHLHLTYYKRADLDRLDFDLLEALGMKVTPSRTYPTFRSYTPGLVPWKLTGAETRFMTHMLEQLLVVAPRVAENFDILFDPHHEGVEDVLFRVADQGEDGITWRDEYRLVEDLPLPPFPQPAIDERSVRVLHQLPKRLITLEVGLALLPVPTRTAADDERGYFPFLLLMVDQRTGDVVAQDLIQPLPDYATVLARVPQLFINHCAQLGFVPASIISTSMTLHEMLLTVAQRLKVNCRLVDETPALEAAGTAYMAHMLGENLSLLSAEIEAMAQLGEPPDYDLEELPPEKPQRQKPKRGKSG